jgi:gliding motility-associated-like protein
MSAKIKLFILAIIFAKDCFSLNNFSNTPFSAYGNPPVIWNHILNRDDSGMNDESENARRSDSLVNKDSSINKSRATIFTNTKVAQTGFIAPDSVCTNKPVNIINTSTGASTYYWTFCGTNFSQPPDATNLGNPGSLLDGPVFMDIAQDNAGNFFVLCVNNYNSHVTRLSFGNSLLNTPVADDLGDFSGLISGNAEGIQIVNTNGKWIAIVVGGDPLSGNPSYVAKIDFGVSLASTTPVATNWSNVGGLDYPLELYVFEEGNVWYGYTVNSRNSTITEFNFGTDFSAPPTGVNLGNIGSLNTPVGMSAVNNGGNWFIFITNDIGNTITRLSFGSSLLNTPVAVNIGNPQGSLVTPRDISFIQLCNDIQALVVNANNNSITQLDFGSDLTTIPSTISLGNQGGLSFPHSITKMFRVNNDIYSFVPNVNSNTLTRIRFAGCSLQSSTLQNPAPIVYTEPGVYYINLLTDVGLPTQSSFCKQVVVTDCCKPIQGTFSGNSICVGQAGQLTFHITSSPVNSPFTIQYSDQSNAYTQLNVQDDVPFNFPTNPTTTTQYSLLKITDAEDCSSDITGVTANVNVFQPASFTVTHDTSICTNSSIQLNVSGGQNYTWLPSGLLNNPNIANPIASPVQTTRFYVSGNDLNNCPVIDSVLVNFLPPTVFKIPPDTATCVGKPVLLNGNNNPGFLYVWSPAVLLNNPNSPTPQALLDLTTNFTVKITDPVCPEYNSSYQVQVIVNPSPVIILSKSNDIDCSTLTSQLNASGAASYSWIPTDGLSNAASATPIARISATTQFIVQGTSANGCTAYDSVTVVVNKTGQNLFSVPNAFSPNNDGVNDCFGIRNWGNVTLRDFSIYNRWGQKVFQTTNPSQCWDGTFQGEQQPVGGFVYVIKASSFCQENIVRQGIVMLIR